jgi:tripartite-type tricarboxylate transporter receptor subunit TctC
MLAAHLTNAMGQQFYVENRGGAGNILGLEIVARAPADGYTLSVGAGTITSNQLFYKNIPYDVLRDFTPVTQLVSVPNVLIVNPSLKIRTLAEFIAEAKRRPGQINFGSAGVGSNLHLSMELLKTMTGIDVVHVPYKGVGPAMSDLLGGHLASMISNVTSAKQHVDSGKLVAVGVTSLKRTPAMPEVPSIAEAGIKDYEVLNWFGMFAPAGTPAEIIKRLQAEAATLLLSADVRRRLADEGAEAVASDPAAFAAFVKAEIAKWDEVGRVAKITPQN